MPIINVRLLAKIFILNTDGKVLILQRSKNDDRRPLGWDLPGGNVEYNEDPNAAVLRELKEEAGLVVNSAQIFNVASETEDHYIVTLLYYADALSEDVTLSHEHEQYKWVSLLEMTDIDMPEKYIKAAEQLLETGNK